LSTKPDGEEFRKMSPASRAGDLTSWGFYRNH